MRKVLIIAFAAFVVMALISGDALACGSNKTGDKTTCGASKITAQTVSAKEGEVTAVKAGCSYSKGATAETQLTTEEHAKLCNYKGKCEFKTISIKGMTCGGCENSVSAVLANVPGVIKVINVSYKDEVAEVCIDPTKVTGEVLTMAVVNKGYEAAIVPAVAKSSDADVPSKLTGAKASCSAAGKDKAKTKSDAEGPH